jgi:hypothetical protein
MRQHSSSFVREDKSIAGTLKQRLAEGEFKRAESAAHRRLAFAQLLSGSSQRAFPGNGEKNAKVTPFHRLAIQ